MNSKSDANGLKRKNYGEKIKLGTIVLIKEKNLLCTQWALGRVMDVHPDKDHIIWTVTVKTATGKLKRVVKYICPLPIEQYPNVNET